MGSKNGSSMGGSDVATADARGVGRPREGDDIVKNRTVPMGQKDWNNIGTLATAKRTGLARSMLQI